MCAQLVEKVPLRVANSVPKDRYYQVYAITYFTGIVILLPWNILITVNGYWDYKFRNVTVEEEGGVWQDAPPTKLQKEFTSYVAIAANVPGALFTILHALIGHKFNMKLRILWGQIVLDTVFVGIIVLSLVNSDDWQREFMIANLCFIVVICSAGAIFQGAFTACLGTFPVTYMGACINGAGMGGLLPSIVSVIILAADANEQMAGFGCFVFAWTLAIICLVLTLRLQTNPVWEYYSSLEKDKTTAFTLKDDLNAYWEIVKDGWVYLLTTLLNFTTTLVVFPAVTVLIESSSDKKNKWTEIYLVPVGCFVLFNFGDCVGKYLSAWIRWPRTSGLHQAILLTSAVLRIGLIPLLMFCNVSPQDRNTEVIFESDGYYFFFVAVLAISNGYVGNIAMMFGPKAVKTKYQEITAAFLIACLVLGCALGSILSTPIVRLL